MNFLLAASLILFLMVILWLISIPLKNVSIVDAFWGTGFVVVNVAYFMLETHMYTRNLVVLCLVSVWGIRLSAYLFKRNYGKPEDFRYQEFRSDIMEQNDIGGSVFFKFFFCREP